MRIKTCLAIFCCLPLLLASCNNEDEILLSENFSGESRSSEFIFPDYWYLVNDIQSYPTMMAAWKETLAFASPSGRREMGFFIYSKYVPAYNQWNITIGKPIYGPAVGADEGAYLVFGQPEDYNTVCAFFHTHTPYTYASGSRKTGPSEDDECIAAKFGFLGLVYDYLEDRIWGGYPLNSPADVYGFGHDRDVTPIYPIEKQNHYYKRPDGRKCALKTATAEEHELVKKAVEIADFFGPDYKISDTLEIYISDFSIFNGKGNIYPEKQAQDGRKYFSIMFYGPFPNQRDFYSTLATVDFWENGEPLAVFLGKRGYDFIRKSYEEMRKDNSVKKIPLPTFEAAHQMEKILERAGVPRRI